MQLQDAGYNMVLIELSQQCCINAVRHGLNSVICSSINGNDFNSNSIDYCILLDVLEHIENDLQFIKSIKDKLKIGGKIIVMTPAFQSLWSSQDKVAGHFRRYRRKQLISVLSDAGFNILHSSYFFSFLMLPIYLISVIGEKIGIVETYQQNKEIAQKRMRANKIVSLIIGLLNKIEINLLLRKIRIPFGSSIVVIAQNGDSLKA